MIAFYNQQLPKIRTIEQVAFECVVKLQLALQAAKEPENKLRNSSQVEKHLDAVDGLLYLGSSL
jgi:hypothetical protein